MHSAPDSIGDNKGRLLFFGINSLRDWAIESNKIATERSILEFDNTPETSTEGLAIHIASQIYRGKNLDLGNSTFKILTHISHLALDRSNLMGLDRLVQYIWPPSVWVPQIQSVSILSRAFDAGMTEADLIAAGIPIEVVIQLKWWQRREGESLLQQHIRAELAGWALPSVAAAYRANFTELKKAIDGKPEAQDFVNAFKQELDEISELLDFFQYLKTDWAFDPEAEKEWALAFNEDLGSLLPDIKGRFAHLPRGFVAKGNLAEPLTTLARYLVYRDVSPADWKNYRELRVTYFREA